MDTMGKALSSMGIIETLYSTSTIHSNKKILKEKQLIAFLWKTLSINGKVDAKCLIHLLELTYHSNINNMNKAKRKLLNRLLTLNK